MCSLFLCAVGVGLPLRHKHCYVPDPHGKYLRAGVRITWFEIRRYLAHRPDTLLIYVRAGHTPRILDRTAQELAFRAPPWLLRKLLLFRPLGPPAAAVCDW